MDKTIDMAHEVYGEHTFWTEAQLLRLKAFEALVRADERNSWPAEMEAMERQVNILTDALAAEREACAKVCEAVAMGEYDTPEFWREGVAYTCAAAIRARGNT